MDTIKNIQLSGSAGRAILLDVYPARAAKGTLVFAHGIKGFKDWGHWWVLGRQFARAGYTFVPFNFSHDGTSPEQPDELTDLQAFSENTYSKELADLQKVIDWVTGSPAEIPEESRQTEALFLIGHSRGGPICLGQAARDSRVSGLITWASVASLDYAWPDEDFLRQWREEGMYRIVNQRTQQVIPIRYELYTDYRENLDRLDTARTGPLLDKPCLIVHGGADEAVPLQAARTLQERIPGSRLAIVPDGNHVFGGKHPWTEPELPEASRRLLDHCLDFLA